MREIGTAVDRFHRRAQVVRDVMDATGATSEEVIQVLTLDAVCELVDGVPSPVVVS